MTNERVIAWHITMRLEGGRVVCVSAAARRRASRVLFERGEDRGLVVFGIADTHIHAILLCTRAEAGVFARAVESALHWKLDGRPRFEPARFTPILTQAHFLRAFWYVLRQESHHRTALDPFHDGSSLPDLIGARVLLGGRCDSADGLGRATAARVAAHLPRVTRGELMAEMGVLAVSAGRPGWGPAARVGDDTVTPVEPRRAGPPGRAPLLLDPALLAHLGSAAAAAVGLDEASAQGHARTVARRAAVHLAGRALSPSDTALALGITSRAIRALRTEAPRADVVVAIALQLLARGAAPSLAAPRFA